MIRQTTSTDLPTNQPPAPVSPTLATAPTLATVPTLADLAPLDDWETSLAETTSAGPATSASPLDSTGLDDLPTDWQDSSDDEPHQPDHEPGDVDPTAMATEPPPEEHRDAPTPETLTDQQLGTEQLDAPVEQPETEQQSPEQPPEMGGTIPPENVNRTSEHQSKHEYRFAEKVREIRHELVIRRTEIQQRVTRLEHEIAEHHATMQRLAAERKSAKESMDEAGDERRGLVDEWQGIEYDLANPEMLEARARQALADEAKQSGGAVPRGSMPAASGGLVMHGPFSIDPAAASAEYRTMILEEPGGQIRAQFDIPPNVRVASIPAGARVIDPATTAPLTVLKISPGRLESLRSTEATPGRNCSTVADLELLIREGRLQHVSRFGPAAIDAVTDALIDWRQRNPVPQPVEQVERVEESKQVSEFGEPREPEQVEEPEAPEDFPAADVALASVIRSEISMADFAVPGDLVDDPEESAWWQSGAVSARLGRPVHSNPHLPGSRAAKIWDRGWQDQAPADDLED